MATRHSHIGTVLTSAGTIAIFSLVSRLLGLLRDRLLAGSFGAGAQLDAYYAAFKVPDFLYNLLVLGGLTAAFVPVVGGLLAKGRTREANATTSATLTLLIVAITVLAGAAAIGAPLLIQWTAPGFEGPLRDETILLTRIMLISPVIFGISSVVSSYLNTVRRFTAYAIAPVAYNLGIIAGIVWLAPTYGTVGLAIGVVGGAVLHLLVQLPALARAGFKLVAQAPWRSRHVARLLRLAGPRLVSIGAMQINVLVVTAIGTTLASGTVAAYNLAYNLQSVPLGLVGISLATAIFPLLASAASHNDVRGFLRYLTHTLGQTFFLTIPLSLAILLLRVEVVRLTLGTGAFDFQDTYFTAAALGVFAMSLFAQAAVPILARAFYSLENTRTPVIISLVTVALNIVGALTLGPRLGVLGLAFAFSGAAVIDFLLHAILLRNHLGELGERVLLTSVGRTVLASTVGGLGLLVTRLTLVQFVPLQSFIEVLFVTVAAVLVGGILYVLVHWSLRSSELKEVLSLLRRRRSKRTT